MAKFIRAGLLVLLSSCAHAPLTAPEPQPAEAAWYGDLHALAEQAAKVRGMTLTQRFDVVPMSDAEFFAAWDEVNRESAAVVLEEFKETFRALTFTQADTTLLEGLLRDQVAGVHGEQLMAFYHFATGRLVVRQTLPQALVDGGEEVRRTVLAHEVGHVLQDQLGLGSAEVTSFEQAIARRAVLEGDANLTATLVEGARKGLTPQRAVERARLVLGSLTNQQIIELGGFSPKLLSASPVVRDLFVFPYFRGQRFVTDVYAAGGLALVGAMLERPPVTSDAILNPQRWLDGGGSRTSAAGPTPRRLGALLLRSLVESCNQTGSRPLPPEALEWIERHYIDDSFQRTGDALAWVTAWDDREPLMPAEAERQLLPVDEKRLNMALAAKLMRVLPECLGVPEGDITTAVEGSAVGVSVRAPGEAARLAKLPRPPAAPPPLGRHVIPQPRMDLAFRAAGQGVLRDGRWVHPKLELSMDWPEGSTLVDNPVAALTVMAKGAALFGSFLDAPATDREADGFLNALAATFFKARKVGPKEVSLGVRHVWREVDLGGVKAREATVSFERDITVRSRAVPMCGGNAAFYVVAFALKPEAVALVDRWMDSLRGPAEVPLCSEP